MSSCIEFPWKMFKAGGNCSVACMMSIFKKNKSSTHYSLLSLISFGIFIGTEIIANSIYCSRGIYNVFTLINVLQTCFKCRHFLVKGLQSPEVWLRSSAEVEVETNISRPRGWASYKHIFKCFSFSDVKANSTFCYLEEPTHGASFMMFFFVVRRMAGI